MEQLTPGDIEWLREYVARNPDRSNGRLWGRFLATLDDATARAERAEETLQSSLIITPDRAAREDDWKRVKRIMMKPDPLSNDEVGVIVRCLEDSMRQELALGDELTRLREFVNDIREMDRVVPVPPRVRMGLRALESC